MVFIGDGLSDLEGCHVADQVYARDELLEYCQEKDIPAIGFTSMEGAYPEVEGTLSDHPSGHSYFLRAAASLAPFAFPSRIRRTV